MFESFKKQPEVPNDVALFLEGERGRMTAELGGTQTTEHRTLIDEAMGEYEKAGGVMGAVHQVDPQVAMLQTAFVFNALQETITQLPTFLLDRSPGDPGKASYVATCTGLGRVLLHGFRVVRWFDANPQSQLVIDNAISAGVSASLAGVMDSQRNARRVARLLVDQKRRALLAQSGQ